MSKSVNLTKSDDVFVGLSEKEFQNERNASNIANMSSKEIDELHGTFKYTELEAFSKVMTESLSSEKFDEEVLAYYNMPNEGLAEKLRGNTIVDSNKCHVREFVSKTTSFFNNLDVKVVPRRNLEYDVRFKQLCVAVLVYNGDDMLLLESLEGPLQGQSTMIQGHVSYDTDYFKMSAYNFMKKNAIRELMEEIEICEEGRYQYPANHLEEICKTMKDKLFININVDAETLLDICHVGLVYSLNIKDENLFKLIRSKEPEKHKVVKKNLNNVDNADKWLRLVIQELSR